MATQTEAAQKITAAFKEAERQILPARLAHVTSNSFSIMAFITAKMLDPAQVDSYLTTFRQLYKSLEWAVKPAKLLADENNSENKVTLVESALASEKKRSDKLKAAEKADEKRKLDEASIEQAKTLIGAYNPVRNNRYDERERIDSQKKWTAELNQAIEQKRNLQDWVKALAAKIQKRYADRERERM